MSAKDAGGAGERLEASLGHGALYEAGSAAARPKLIGRGCGTLVRRRGERLACLVLKNDTGETECVNDVALNAAHCNVRLHLAARRGVVAFVPTGSAAVERLCCAVVTSGVLDGVASHGAASVARAAHELRSARFPDTARRGGGSAPFRKFAAMASRRGSRGHTLMTEARAQRLSAGGGAQTSRAGAIWGGSALAGPRPVRMAQNLRAKVRGHTVNSVDVTGGELSEDPIMDSADGATDPFTTSARPPTRKYGTGRSRARLDGVSSTTASLYGPKLADKPRFAAVRARPPPVSPLASHRLPSAFGANRKQPVVDLTDHIASTTSARASRGGLKNLGNTCYMNAVLQSVLALRPLIRQLKSHPELQAVRQRDADGSLLEALLDLHAKINADTSGTASYVSDLKRVRSALGRVKAEFAGFEQQDAHEFLNQCLELLESDVHDLFVADACLGAAAARPSSRRLPSPKKARTTAHSDASADTGEGAERKAAAAAANGDDDKGADDADADAERERMAVELKHWDAVDDAFVLEVEHELRCATCDDVSVVTEIYRDLSITLPKIDDRERTELSLPALLDDFFADDVLERRCEKGDCDGVFVRVKHRLTRLPRVLVLHLKRFHANYAAGTLDKLRRPIRAPATLDIAFCCAPEVTVPEGAGPPGKLEIDIPKRTPRPEPPLPSPPPTRPPTPSSSAAASDAEDDDKKDATDDNEENENEGADNEAAWLATVKVEAAKIGTPKNDNKADDDDDDDDDSPTVVRVIPASPAKLPDKLLNKPTVVDDDSISSLDTLADVFKSKTGEPDDEWQSKLPASANKPPTKRRLRRRDADDESDENGTLQTTTTTTGHIANRYTAARLSSNGRSIKAHFDGARPVSTTKQFDLGETATAGSPGKDERKRIDASEKQASAVDNERNEQRKVMRRVLVAANVIVDPARDLGDQLVENKLFETFLNSVGAAAPPSDNKSPSAAAAAATISASESGAAGAMTVADVKAKFVEPPQNADAMFTVYTLHALTLHRGRRVGSGHYVALVRKSAGSWTLYNDSLVKEKLGVDELDKEATKREGYIYFFVNDQFEESSQAFAAQRRAEAEQKKGKRKL